MLLPDFFLKNLEYDYITYLSFFSFFKFICYHIICNNILDN